MGKIRPLVLNSWFYARIGPLQLGVVLVFLNFHFYPFFSLCYQLKYLKLPVAIFDLRMWYLDWEDFIPLEEIFMVKGVILIILGYFQKYDFCNCIEISMACDVSFYATFLFQGLWWNNFISFQDPHRWRGEFFKIYRKYLGALWKGTGDWWLLM